MAQSPAAGACGRRHCMLLVLIVAISMLLAIFLYCWCMVDNDGMVGQSTCHHSSTNDTALPPPSVPASLSVVQLVMSPPWTGNRVIALLVFILTATLILMALKQIHIPIVHVTPEPIPEPLPEEDGLEPQRVLEAESLEMEMEVDKEIERQSSILWLVGASAVANLVIAVTLLSYLSAINKWKINSQFAVSLIVCVLFQQGIALMALIAILLLYNMLVIAHKEIWNKFGQDKISKRTHDNAISAVSISMALLLLLAMVAELVAFPILAVLSCFTVVSPNRIFIELGNRLFGAVFKAYTIPSHITLENIPKQEIGKNFLKIRPSKYIPPFDQFEG